MGGSCGPTGASEARWSGRFSGISGVFALIEPVALAVHLENMDMVGQAVEQCAGEPLGSEYLGPFVEWQVGG